jgi:two-component system sensor histidine kinase YesM
MRTFFAAFRNMGLFPKLFLAFGLIMVVPLFISYFVSQQATTQVVINRVFEETVDSLEVVGNQIEDLLQRMIYVSLYVNNDDNLKSILLESDYPSAAVSQSDKLRMWNRLNTVGKMFENLTFNVMRTKCYLTLISMSGYTYTSWSSLGTDLSRFAGRYRGHEQQQGGMYVRWVGLESNPLGADAMLYPHVITLTKSLSDRQGNARFGTIVVSIPEAEVRALMGRKQRARTWLLVDRDLTVLSGSDPAAVGSAFLPPERQGLLVGDAGSFLTDIGGIGRALVAYRRIRGGDWTLLAVESYASITAQLDRIRFRLVWVNVLSALAFVIVAALIASSITKPIHALAEDMRDPDTDVSDRRSRQQGRSDEIGILQASYDTMRRRIKRLLRQVSEKEKKKREAELEALQLQISPHFLFNTLASVRWAILNNRSRKAADMTFALGNLLRMSLLKTNELITVQQEMENLAHYLDIVTLRRANSFRVSYHVDDGIREELVPRLFLQPIVENAIIHGLDPARTDGLVEITARREAGTLVFSVRDNGRGMRHPTPPRAEKGARLSGIGIRNVDERIKLIYGRPYGLRSQSAPGKGMSVTIVLPAMRGRTAP